jgi:ubiquitin C-terminal hydrolase
MSSDVKGFFANKGINGLMNTGNTCYINTSVQCLGHCINFLHFVLSGQYSRNTGHLLNELRELLKELWINNNGVVPNRFLKHLREQMRGLDIMDQNDIQEFLTMFIDKLNYSISKKIEPTNALKVHTYQDTQYDKLRLKLDIAWYNTNKNEFSPLLEYFYGQTVVQIVCGNCEKIHHNYELFSILLLPIKNEEQNILDCIRHYSSTEYLNDSGHNDWKCDGCNQQTISMKSMKFWRLPKILGICLKRFTYDLRKNNTLVKIPEEIDMKEFLLGPSKSIYKLCSVACHIGSFSNGHYYAICRNPNGIWYKIDDTSINPLGTEFETPLNAYMAFYEVVG